MPDEKTREEIHADVDSALDEAQERENEQNWRTSFEARLVALEGKPEIPGYDDTAVREEIGEVKSNLDKLVDTLLQREERNASTKTDASVSAEPPTTPMATPTVQTRVNTSVDEERERPPRNEHSLFRRFGRR